ncbi:hypothetical protein HYX05_00410 [Candidatus Woesearchaeota archaeon]|nr:hypothetical protein [Candidatus Woesearchaeota archaeon]
MSPKKKHKNYADADSIISRLKELSKEDKAYVISYFANELKSLYAGRKEISDKKEINIPIGAFGNDVLSSLEAIVKYLKEESKLRFSKIAKLLNRSSKTIWATYHNAVKKMPSSFGAVSRDVMIPVSAFADRTFSTLESLVAFVKDLGYSNHDLALMLRLDDRTIWTVYARVKKKRGAK